MLDRTVALSLLALAALAPAVVRADDERLEFTRMVAHWARYSDPEFLDFVAEARPEIVQHGFYGAHFWSLAHTPAFSGYPAHLPVQGLPECGRWFAQRNADLHERGAKVVGHFNVEFLVGDPDGPDGPRGFFDFYRNHWNEDELGPKPVDDPLALLEVDAEGRPISQKGYGIGGMREYWACLRNPHWKAVLKAWVKRGVDRGLDGFIVNYFYRHDCHCVHCRRGFRRYLGERFTDGQLRERFGIEDLATHRFPEIVYWHDPQKTTPLRLEMLRWSQISNKRTFDEVFVEYGRKLKPDLIVAQWNHLGRFSQIKGDERCLLPAELWGRDEDYLWYSTGATAHVTDLAKGNLGEGTLQARYIRAAFDDKPFTLGKYESTRIRTAIAELAANGGAPMGFYTRWHDPRARREIVRYYRFLARHDALFRASRPHAEVALLYPRKAVHAGDVAPVQAFLERGTQLLNQHVLFDVIPDDLADEALRSRYRHVLEAQDSPQPLGKDTALSRFDLPQTVRVSASRPVSGSDVVLHFVNYDRHEPPQGRNGKPSPGRGIQDEKPIAVEGGTVDFALPEGERVTSVTFLTPENEAGIDVPFRRQDGRVTFELPEFLVYGVAHLQTSSRPNGPPSKSE